MPLVRTILRATPILVFLAAPTYGEELLLRLDRFESSGEKRIASTPAESMDLVVRPGERFGCVHVEPPRTIRFDGRVAEETDGEFEIHLAIRISKQTGDWVPNADGTRRPVLDETSVRTRLVVELGKPIDIGGFQVRTAGETRSTTFRMTLEPATHFTKGRAVE